MKTLCSVCGAPIHTNETLEPGEMFVCDQTIQQRRVLAHGQEILSPCMTAAVRWWSMTR